MDYIVSILLSHEVVLPAFGLFILAFKYVSIREKAAKRKQRREAIRHRAQQLRQQQREARE